MHNFDVEEIEKLNQSGIWLYDFATKEFLWSEGLKKLLESDTPKSYSQFLNLIHQKDRSLFVNIFYQTHAPDREFTFRTNPKRFEQTRVLLNRLFGIYDEHGNVTGFKGICTEITRALWQDRFFQGLFSLDAICHAIVNREGILLDCNDELLRLTGYAKEEIQNRMLDQILDSEAIDNLLAMMNQKKPIADRKEITIYGKYQQKIYAVIDIKAIDGLDLFTLAITDVTDVINKKHLFQTIFHLPNAGHAILAPGPKLVQCNEKYEALTGYTEAELQQIDMEDLLVGESLHFFRENFQQRMRDQPVKNDYEIQLKRKNGQLIWLHVHIEHIPKTVNYFTTIQDITNQKAYKQELIDTINERNSFRDALNSAALVSITNLEGRIIFANQKFEEVAKYERAELLGQDHNVLNSGHHPRSFWMQMWRQITKGKSWRAEVKNRAKDGSYYWVDTIITPIKDLNDQIYQYMSVRYLITDRKQIEEQQQRLLKDLENYTFMTSHTLRGPLARMLGLVNLIKDHKIGDELPEMLTMLEITAQEMDDVIRSMNDLLNRNAEMLSERRSNQD